MRLEEYISEGISSGKNRRKYKSVEDIDRNILIEDFIDLLEEMGYVLENDKDKEFSFFEAGERDRYRIVELYAGTKRVLIKNTNKDGRMYFRAVFKNRRLDSIKSIILEHKDDNESVIKDVGIKELIDYINNE